MFSIDFLGQCGFVIKSESLKIAIDPVLNDMKDSEGITIRNYPPVMKPEELAVDFIFCTHDHIDHMATETLVAAFGAHPNTKFVVPNGCVSELVAGGVKEINIISLASSQSISLESGKLKVKGISVAHPVHGKDSQGLDHNLAYEIVMDGQHLVHLGDTYYTRELADSLKALEHIDLLFTPINGRVAERPGNGMIGNMSAEESAALAKLLRVGTVIPTHFDMVKGNTVDPEIFMGLMMNGCEDIKCIVPELNQSIVLDF